MSSVHIPARPIELDGELVLPPSATGVVLFAHGIGTLLIVGSAAKWFEKHL